MCQARCKSLTLLLSTRKRAPWLPIQTSLAHRAPCWSCARLPPPTPRMAKHPALDGNNRVGACPRHPLDGISGAPLDGISGTSLDGISAIIKTSIEGALCKAAEALHVKVCQILASTNCQWCPLAWTCATSVRYVHASNR